MSWTRRIVAHLRRRARTPVRTSSSVSMRRGTPRVLAFASAGAAFKTLAPALFLAPRGDGWAWVSDSFTTLALLRRVRGRRRPSCTRVQPVRTSSAGERDGGGHGGPNRVIKDA